MPASTSSWKAPVRPAYHAETRLIEAILEGQFPIQSSLPAERELAALLGVTRPTLREALQRLARDGWVEIHHGKSTRVRNYWHEGGLGLLGALAEHPQHLPDGFIPQLLEVRRLLAPEYARLAVEARAGDISALLRGYQGLPDRSQEYADADWRLHHSLTIWSGNPIFTLILNGFRELYQSSGGVYFASPQARRVSQEYYLRLLAAAESGDATLAEQLTRHVMTESLELWKRVVRLR